MNFGLVLKSDVKIKRGGKKKPNIFFVQPTGPENLFVNYLSRIHREEVRLLSSPCIILVPNNTVTVLYLLLFYKLTKNVLFRMAVTMKKVRSTLLNLFFPICRTLTLC